MARRHQIVHTGDLVASEDKQQERDPAPIGVSKVKEWFEAVLSFISAVAANKLKAGV
jgi:hypothetical protein